MDFFKDNKSVIRQAIIIFVIILLVLAVVFFQTKGWVQSISNSKAENAAAEAREEIYSLEGKVQEKKSNIDVYLQRRLDLIPNLVSTVEACSEHEEAIFTAVTEAHQNLLENIKTNNFEGVAESQKDLEDAFQKFLAYAEETPELKSHEQYVALMDELAGTENRITVARKNYNEAVSAYNDAVRRYRNEEKWPQDALVTHDYPLFEASPEANRAPEVFG